MNDISGTMQVQTFAMLCRPPRITSATMTARTSPEIQFGTAKVLWTIAAMALVCTRLPVPSTAMAATTLKNTAIQRHFRPRRMVYMGPPWTSPLRSRTRYFTASSDSAYFVDMPKIPVTMHQNTAPGPPMQTAVATPTMLPVPIVEASATANAAKGDTFPFMLLSRSIRTLNAVPRYFWTNRSRNV